MSETDDLTPKQHRFVIEYLKDENGKAAAIRAGYAPRYAANQAYELMQLPKIKRMIDKERTDSNDRIRLDVDWITSRLMKEAEEADNSGGERIRALELLGKVKGMFVERKEVNVNVDSNFFASIEEPPALDGGELTALPDYTRLERARGEAIDADWSELEGDQQAA